MRTKSDDVKKRDEVIGNRIRFLRQEADLALIDVAEAIGMAVQTVSKYETGEISVSTDRAEALARVFKVRPIDIVGWAPPEPPKVDPAPLPGPPQGGPAPSQPSWYAFEVPRPPSLNSFQRGRGGKPLGNSGNNVTGWKARANACLMATPGRYPRIKGAYAIDVTFPASEFKQYDPDNYFKALCDWMQAIEMVENDKLARHGAWHFSQTVIEGMIRIRVRAWVDKDIPPY